MVKDIVLNILSEITGIEDTKQIRMQMSFVDHLNMDEGDMDTLIESLEAEFDIELDMDFEEFETVGDLVTYIKSEI